MSTDEYTPTTEQVRDGYSIDPEDEYRDPINASANRRWAAHAFDRWLAAHDAEIRAERVAPESDWHFTYAEMTEHNALVWADGVTAMARGSVMRMNASDVKRGNPYHFPPNVEATMTDELADRLDGFADETTRAADALLMREAAATIRAERVAPEAEQVNTYRISYQKYWLTTPGNFASVRDAVEDAFRAGWEAHTPHAVDRPIETSPGGVGFARRKGWLADPTPNPYQKEPTDEH